MSSADWSALSRVLLLANMNAVENKLLVTLVFFCYALTSGCTRSQSLAQVEETKIVESVIGSFVQDWGMPGHPEAIPKRCYLENRYRSVPARELDTAARMSDPDERRAIAAIPRNTPIELHLARETPCILVNQSEIESLQAGHIYAGGILSISRVGFDGSNQTAAILIREARGDLAGSVWIVILKKKGDIWSITRRLVILRS